LPDWVTHLGTTYIASQAGFRIRPGLTAQDNVRHLFIGALLPDATRFTIILVDVLDWPAIPTFTYLIPFHSLLITALLGGMVALLLPSNQGSSRSAFGSIMAGAVFHFLLDDLEGWVGCGSTTFYPFYFGKPISGWNSEGNVAAMLLVVAAIALGVALSQRQRWAVVRLRLTRLRLIGALALLTGAILLPLFFRQWMIGGNAYYLAFIQQPDAFAGQSVELCFSEVIATDPPVIEEFDSPFELQTSETLRAGEWVSVRGIYENGVIRPTVLIRHRGFSDVSLSLIAAVVFVFLVFDWKWLRAFARQRD
jgi:hypothetical protein